VTRALQVLFEGVTLGSITQDVFHPATGYIAFGTLTLYLFAWSCWPAADTGRLRPAATYTTDAGPDQGREETGRVKQCNGCSSFACCRREQRCMTMLTRKAPLRRMMRAGGRRCLFERTRRTA